MLYALACVAVVLFSLAMFPAAARSWRESPPLRRSIKIAALAVVGAVLWAVVAVSIWLSLRR